MDFIHSGCSHNTKEKRYLRSKFLVFSNFRTTYFGTGGGAEGFSEGSLCLPKRQKAKAAKPTKRSRKEVRRAVPTLPVGI